MQDVIPTQTDTLRRRLILISCRFYSPHIWNKLHQTSTIRTVMFSFFGWSWSNDALFFCSGLMAPAGELAPPAVYLHQPVNIKLQSCGVKNQLTSSSCCTEPWGRRRGGGGRWRSWGVLTTGTTTRWPLLRLQPWSLRERERTGSESCDLWEECEKIYWRRGGSTHLCRIMGK